MMLLNLLLSTQILTTDASSVDTLISDLSINVAAASASYLSRCRLDSVYKSSRRPNESGTAGGNCSVQTSKQRATEYTLQVVNVELRQAERRNAQDPRAI
jgi:hypothetical protein